MDVAKYWSRSFSLQMASKRSTLLLERLGLKKISDSLGLILKKNQRSRSLLTLRPHRLVVQAHFQQHKFIAVSIGNKLSAALHAALYAIHTVSVFYAINSLNSCIIKQIALLST